MMRSSLPVRALSIITILSTAACTLLPERPPSPEFHDFGPWLSTTDRSHRWSPVDVTAPDWLQDTKLRYRLMYRQPTRVQFYSLDRWVAPPTDLLSQALTARGNMTGCPLHVHLLTLEQVFTDPGHAHVAIDFIARIGDSHADIRHPAMERRFAFSHRCTSPDAAGAVAAYSQAVEEASENLDSWLQSLLHDATPVCDNRADQRNEGIPSGP